MIPQNIKIVKEIELPPSKGVFDGQLVVSDRVILQKVHLRRG
jgi:hypothetical protein